LSDISLDNVNLDGGASKIDTKFGVPRRINTAFDFDFNAFKGATEAAPVIEKKPSEDHG
jgi:hypothetical protein